MNYTYQILNKEPLTIRELPNEGPGYIHYVEELKVKEFFEAACGLSGQKTTDSFLRTRKWLEEYHPELLL